MRAVDIIIKKRDGQELTSEEIRFFIEGFTNGTIPDYQASAWAMTVMLNGMSDRETTDLTLAMAHSGEMLDLSSAVEIAIDKHSTGGVGDKTTLVVGPIAAACGLPVGKMSGRGLGFSGGTLDKMESIPGYRCDLSQEEFLAQLREYKIVLTGQSADLAPADGKMYALRDVTGTVPSMPLIASSVMSKKIAAGAHAIVLDVKLGEGAFMANLEDAQQLARIMVAIGKLSGRRVVALLSDMNQPLGEAVGNALETREAIETLRGGGPADFREHCLVVASHMLVLGQRAKSLDEARQMAEAVLQDGRALEFFRTLVRQQGGDVSYVDQPDKLPKANLVGPLNAPRSGWLKAVRARVIGETSVDLGAGRAKKGDLIDYGVGIIVHHKVGDRVETGDPLFTIHASDAAHLAQAKERLQTAIEWSDTACEPLPLFYGVVEQL
jgi:pyrimidine-nucleoside phosphorylase